MAQAKKKQSTKTAKKQTRSTKSAASRSCQRSQSARQTQCSSRDRNHIYFITALGIITVILLCANAAILMV